MSEKLNNNQEQVVDTGGNGGTEYPPFDPSAAEAARQAAAEQAAIEQAAANQAAAAEAARQAAAEQAAAAEAAREDVERQAAADAAAKAAAETVVGPISPEDFAKAAEEFTHQETESYQKKANYKSEHPDAIEDIDKAHFMALAGDKERTEATKYRELARKNQRKAEDAYLEYLDGSPVITEDDALNDSRGKAFQYGNKMIENQNRASWHDRIANDKEEAAGEFYDSLRNNH